MKDYLDKRLEEQKKGKKGRSDRPLPPKGIAVVGLHEGRTLLASLNRAVYAEARAGCDVDPDKLAEVRSEMPDLFLTTSYAELLQREDVDIVAVFTPDPSHAEHIIAAFAAGKDVICTKPLVNSMADARAVISSARSRDRKLLVGQSTRFFEPFRRQRLDFERGSLGDLEFVDAHYLHRMDWFYEKSPWAVHETDWVFLGMSHPLDLLRWYLGPIAEVQAWAAASALGRRYGLNGFDIYSVNVRAENGKIGRAFGHYGLHELPSARNAIELMLYGTRSTSMAQYHDMKYRFVDRDGTEICQDPLYACRHYYFNSEIHGMHYGEFANYSDYFSEALLEGNPFSPDLHEGIETFCVMEAVRRSSLTGAPVRVEPLLREAGLRD